MKLVPDSMGGWLRSVFVVCFTTAVGLLWYCLVITEGRGPRARYFHQAEIILGIACVVLFLVSLAQFRFNRWLTVAGVVAAGLVWMAFQPLAGLVGRM